MSGSEFEEVFVGVGAKRVRELFSAAKKRAPCIIFIDEIDAVGSHRNPKDQQAMKMTLNQVRPGPSCRHRPPAALARASSTILLNQLLVEMDGFQQNSGVMVLAATNFPEALDRALIRPGRFDTRVVVPLPDVKGRSQILEHYSKPVPLDDAVDLETIARATPGFSGADLSNLMNVAALKASHDDKKKVGMSDLEYACDKIRMGAERKSAAISPGTMGRASDTAHCPRLLHHHAPSHPAPPPSTENLKLRMPEGGHALVALWTEAAMPIHKATIVPGGDTLGMVAYLPEKDQMNLSGDQMLAHLDICMGGRVAEELIFGRGKVTTGAGSDLQQATSMARSMVAKYGMSETLGPIFLSDRGSRSSRPRRASSSRPRSKRCCRRPRRTRCGSSKRIGRNSSGWRRDCSPTRLWTEEIDLVLAGKKLPAALKPQAAG